MEIARSIDLQKIIFYFIFIYRYRLYFNLKNVFTKSAQNSLDWTTLSYELAVDPREYSFALDYFKFISEPQQLFFQIRSTDKK